jgi:hypothetical protein
MDLREALTVAVLAALAALPLPAAAQIDRFALVVGNDVGQAPDAPLRWSEADASRVADVLQDVGGVRPENLVLLRGRDAATVRRALIAVNERIRSSPRQTVLLVYYSGHADAGALHLGASSLELAELEQLVRGSAAGFRVLVLDACRSGALTRVKGGEPIPPFELRVSERLPGEGAVFLTSSSASEDSQESDELKGSFFTHALVSGLLGAADADADGQVTLEEAYRYAYESTVRGSSRTLAGLQHPTFRYEVRGQGDVVLSTLGQNDLSRGWVEFPPDRTWLVLQGSADGPVVGEIGRDDRVRRLSLRPGRYFVRGRGAEELLEGTITAAAGAATAVDIGHLERTTYARLVRKGGGEARTTAYSLELEGRVRTALASEGAPCSGLAVGSTMTLRPVTLQARLGWCQSRFAEGPIRTRATTVDLEVGATRAWDWRRTSFELGLLAGASVLHQQFTTTGRAPPRQSTALQLAPVASVSRDLGDRAYLYLSAAGATYVYTVEDADRATTRLRPSFTLRVALGMGARL